MSINFNSISIHIFLYKVWINIICLELSHDNHLIALTSYIKFIYIICIGGFDSSRFSQLGLVKFSWDMVCPPNANMLKYILVIRYRIESNLILLLANLKWKSYRVRCPNPTKLYQGCPTNALWNSNRTCWIIRINVSNYTWGLLFIMVICNHYIRVIIEGVKYNHNYHHLVLNPRSSGFIRMALI